LSKDHQPTEPYEAEEIDPKLKAFVLKLAEVTPLMLQPGAVVQKATNLRRWGLD